jgi:hypothetical protein
VILRDGPRVMGLTTAAVVWVAAALGIVLGAGEFGLAALGTAITLAVLWVFPYIERPIDRLRETRTYEGVCRKNPEQFRRLEAVFTACGLRVRNHKQMKRGDQMTCVYEAIRPPPARRPHGSAVPRRRRARAADVTRARAAPGRRIARTRRASGSLLLQRASGALPAAAAIAPRTPP